MFIESYPESRIEDDPDWPEIQLAVMTMYTKHNSIAKAVKHLGMLTGWHESVSAPVFAKWRDQL